MEKIGWRYGVIDILISLEIVFRFSSIYSMIVLLDKYLRSVWFLGTTEVYFLQEQKKRAPSGDTPCIKYLRLLAHNFSVYGKERYKMPHCIRITKVIQLCAMFSIPQVG